MIDSSQTPGRLLALLGALALGVSVALVGACGGELSGPVSPTVSGRTMGTTWSVKVAALPAALSNEELAAGVQARVDRVDALMSTWKPQSEVSRFNRLGPGEWLEISPETARVLAEALRASEATGGAFDVTVGPLVRLWSFGADAAERRVPSDDELAQVRGLVGRKRLELDESGGRVRKLTAGVEIDLSAIAKGFAVDEVADWLEARSVTDYLVEIGGEVRTRGARADGRPWRVGIEAPTDGRRSVQREIELGSRSLATSGDYRNFFEIDGRRYSHIIDPRTARPVAHHLASVSVVADRCMVADAMATALTVLGPEEGRALADELGLAVLFITRKDTGFAEEMTPAFGRLFPGGRSHRDGDAR